MLGVSIATLQGHLEVRFTLSPLDLFKCMDCRMSLKLRLLVASVAGVRNGRP